MIVLLKLVDGSRVAEMPTCQQTLQAEAPLMSFTLLFGAVIWGWSRPGRHRGRHRQG